MARPSFPHYFKCLTKILFPQRRCLSLHQYQAQHLLAQYEVPVPRGWLATTDTEVANHIDNFGGRGVIKSQISLEGVERESLEMVLLVAFTWSHG